MPKIRVGNSNKPDNAKKANTPVAKGKHQKSVKQSSVVKKRDGKPQEETETSYECLYSIVQANKHKRESEKKTSEQDMSKRPKTTPQTDAEAVQFVDEDDYMEITVKGQVGSEFPSQSEEELSDGELTDDYEEEESQNNNATKGKPQSTVTVIDAQRSAHADDMPHSRPLLQVSESKPTSKTNDELMKTMAIMQNFMVKKGLIDTSMN